MTLIRRTGGALLIAAAMSLPTLASAEQAPSAMCDGTKAEHKEQQQPPTADRSNQDNDKSKQKSDDKSDSNKSSDKNQTGKQS